MKPPYISFVEGSDTDLWIWGLSHPDGTAVVEPPMSIAMPKPPLTPCTGSSPR